MFFIFIILFFIINCQYEPCNNIGEEEGLSGIQRNPKSALLRNGNIIIVWIGNDLNSGIEIGVWGQLYDDEGNSIGSEWLISNRANVNDSSWTSHVDVAAFYDWNGKNGGEPDEGFGVVWTVSMIGGVYGRTYFYNGTARVDEFKMNPTGPTDQEIESYVTVIGDFSYSSACIVACWRTIEGKILTRKYDTTGERLKWGGEIGQNSQWIQGSKDYFGMSVMYGMDEQFAVAWSDGTRAIISRVSTYSGVVQEALVIDTGTSIANVDIECEYEGGIIVVWRKDDTDVTYNIFAAVYETGYNIIFDPPITPIFRVNTYTVFNQDFPRVTSLNDGAYAIVWESENYGSVYSPLSVITSIIDRSGEVIYEYRITEYNGAIGYNYADIIHLNGTKFLYTYQSFDHYKNVVDYNVFGSIFCYSDCDDILSSCNGNGESCSQFLNYGVACFCRYGFYDYRCQTCDVEFYCDPVGTESCVADTQETNNYKCVCKEGYKTDDCSIYRVDKNKLALILGGVGVGCFFLGIPIILIFVVVCVLLCVMYKEKNERKPLKEEELTAIVTAENQPVIVDPDNVQVVKQSVVY